MAMILIVHNWYRSDFPSGENVAVKRHGELLTAKGVKWREWSLSSDLIIRKGLVKKLVLGLRLRGSSMRVAHFIEHLRREKANGVKLIHLHNPWPGFSYDIAAAANEVGLPVVQTLHNYRLIGTNDRFIRASKLARPKNKKEAAYLKRLANNHGRIANFFYNRALKDLWARGIPAGCVDAYCCLTEFQKSLVVQAGIPDEKCFVLPNFLDSHSTQESGSGDFALFVGRLDHTKGIDWLYRWWPHDGPTLKVVGEGPLQGTLSGHPRIEMLGKLSHGEVAGLMGRARILVMASTWFEGLPLVLIEALASGTPCLVPDLGSMATVIEDGITGTLMPAADNLNPEKSDALAREALLKAWEKAPDQRTACRQTYEKRYTPEVHFERLQSIYDKVLNNLKCEDRS